MSRYSARMVHLSLLAHGALFQCAAGPWSDTNADRLSLYDIDYAPISTNCFVQVSIDWLYDSCVASLAKVTAHVVVDE